MRFLCLILFLVNIHLCKADKVDIALDAAVLVQEEKIAGAFLHGVSEKIFFQCVLKTADVFFDDGQKMLKAGTYVLRSNISQEVYVTLTFDHDTVIDRHATYQGELSDTHGYL